MKKHAINNRANQLNPNNNAYHSSRQGAPEAPESTTNGSKTTPRSDGGRTQESPPEGSEQE